jgi:hypothetical protein
MGEWPKARALSRRGLLAGATAVAAWLCLPLPRARAAEGFKRFMRISRNLTGIADLDPSIGETIYELLDMAGRMKVLIGLSDEDEKAQAAREGLEVDVISAWYSGVVKTDKGPKLAAYHDALMWEVLDFTKPFGDCSRDFGSWAKAASG